MRPETELEIRRVMTTMDHLEDRQDQFLSDLKTAEAQIRDRFPGIEFRDSIEWFSELFGRIEDVDSMMFIPGFLSGRYTIRRMDTTHRPRKGDEFSVGFELIRADLVSSRSSGTATPDSTSSG